MVFFESLLLKLPKIKSYSYSAYENKSSSSTSTENSSAFKIDGPILFDDSMMFDVVE